MVKAAGVKGAKFGKSGEYDAVTVRPGDIVTLVEVLRRDMKMDSLDCMTAVDYGQEFELVYHLLSYDTAQTLVAKARVPRENPVIESVAGVYQTANWFEREVLDLFGVEFTNHPNPVRMLRLDDQPGHPLRKDYELRQRISVVPDAD